MSDDALCASPRRLRLLGPQPAAQLHGAAGALRVTWVCDMRPEALEQGADAVPGACRARPTSTWCWTTAEVDAVLIATPISTHYPTGQGRPGGRQARLRREAHDGRHGTQARELVELAAAHGLTLMVGPHLRLQPAGAQGQGDHRRAASWATIYFITTQRVNLGLHQKDVSVVWDLAPHDLSILYYWLGEAADERERRPAVAASCPTSPTSPSSTCASQRRRGRDRGELAQPREAAPHHRRGQPARCSSTTTPRTSRRSRCSTTASTSRTRETSASSSSATAPATSWRPSSAARSRCCCEAQHFVECVATGRRPLTDGVAGLRVVASLEAAAGVARRRRHRDDAHRTP